MENITENTTAKRKSRKPTENRQEYITYQRDIAGGA